MMGPYKNYKVDDKLKDQDGSYYIIIHPSKDNRLVIKKLGGSVQVVTKEYLDMYTKIIIPLKELLHKL